MRALPTRLEIRHAPKGTPYHVNNSRRGIRRTAALGYNAQDVDALITRDGVPVATHWPRPLRHGFTWAGRGRMPSGVTIAELTLAQVGRLEAGPYRVRAVDEILQTAGPLDVTVCLELKPDRRWAKPATYAPLIAAADLHDAALVIMSQPRALGRGVRYLKAAKQAGLPTLLLTRGPVWPTWWKHLTFAKGRRRFAGRGQAQGVVWLGPGSPNGGSRIA